VRAEDAERVAVVSAGDSFDFFWSHAGLFIVTREDAVWRAVFNSAFVVES